MILDEGTLTHKTYLRGAMILFCLIKPGFLKKVFFRNLPFFRTAYPKSSPWPELKPLFLAWGRPAEGRNLILYPTVTIQGKGGSLGGSLEGERHIFLRLWDMGTFQKGIVRTKRPSGHLSAVGMFFPFLLVAGTPSECTKRPILGKDISPQFFHVFGIKGHVSWNFGAFWWFGGSKKQTDFKILGISYFCLLTLQHYFLLRFIVFLRILAAARLRELDWEVYLWSSWWQRPVHRFPVKIRLRCQTWRWDFSGFQDEISSDSPFWASPVFQDYHHFRQRIECKRQIRYKIGVS